VKWKRNRRIREEREGELEVIKYVRYYIRKQETQRGKGGRHTELT
jgi:hypothetical protein